MIYFRGATMYEFQIGKLWFTFLRPRFWCRRATFFRWGWEARKGPPKTPSGGRRRRGSFRLTLLQKSAGKSDVLGTGSFGLPNLPT